MKLYFLLLFFSICSNKYFDIEIYGIFKKTFIKEFKIFEYINVNESIIVGGGCSYKKIYLNIGILDVNNFAISPYINFNVLLRDHCLLFIDFFNNKDSKFDWKIGIKFNYKILNLKVNVNNIYKSFFKDDSNEKIIVNKYADIKLTESSQINDKCFNYESYEKEESILDEISYGTPKNDLIEVYKNNIISCEQYVLACGSQRTLIKEEDIMSLLEHKSTLKIDELIVSLNSFEVSSKKILLMYHLINLRSEYIKLFNTYDPRELVKTFCFFSANDGVNFLKYLNERYSRIIFSDQKIIKKLSQLRKNKDICVETLRKLNYYITLNSNKIESFDILLQCLKNNLKNYTSKYNLSYNMLLDINDIFKSSYKENYNFIGSSLELSPFNFIGLSSEVSNMNELTISNELTYNSLYEIYAYYNNLNEDYLDCDELSENYYMLSLTAKLLFKRDLNDGLKFLLKENETLEAVNLKLLEAHEKDLLKYKFENKAIELNNINIDFRIITKKIFEKKIFYKHDDYKNNIVGVNLSDTIIRLFIERYGISIVNDQIKMMISESYFSKSGKKMKMNDLDNMIVANIELFDNINLYYNYLWMLSLKNKNKYFFETNINEYGEKTINISRQNTNSSLCVDNFYNNLLTKIESNINTYKKYYFNKNSYEEVNYEIILKKFPFFAELDCKNRPKSIINNRESFNLSKEKLQNYINIFSNSVNNFCTSFKELSDILQQFKTIKITKNEKNKQGLILLENIALSASKLKNMNKIGDLKVSEDIEKKIDKYLDLTDKKGIKNAYIWAYNFITNCHYIFDKKFIEEKNYKKYPNIKQMQGSKSYFLFRKKAEGSDNIYKILNKIESNYNSIKQFDFLKRSEGSELYSESCNTRAIYNFFFQAHKAHRKIEDNIDKNCTLMIPDSKKKLKKIESTKVNLGIDEEIKNLNILFDDYLLSDVKYNYCKEIKGSISEIRWNLHLYAQTNEVNKLKILESLHGIRKCFDLIKDKYSKFNSGKLKNDSVILFFEKTEKKLNIYEKMLHELFEKLEREDFSKESGELLYLCVTYIPVGIKDNYIFDSAFSVNNREVNHYFKSRVIDISDTVSF